MAYCAPPRARKIMDRLRSLARKLVDAARQGLRAKPQARAASSDGEALASARRAADGGRLKEAWALYRQLPPTPALFPEIYDLASALAAHGAADEAADLFHRIAQVDGEFRDVAHRLVRANHVRPGRRRRADAAVDRALSAARAHRPRRDGQRVSRPRSPDQSHPRAEGHRSLGRLRQSGLRARRRAFYAKRRSPAA